MGREKIRTEENIGLQNMREVLSPLSPNPDPQSLNPGLVHAERSYRGILKEPKIALTGKSGHTGIFLGTIGSAAEIQVLTIAASGNLGSSGKEFVLGLNHDHSLARQSA